MPRLGKSFFQRDPEICARELIGCVFQWGESSGRIVETEAYAEHGDEACHTFFRPSTRQFVADHPAGTAYIYLNYGVHWLTNILCINPGDGESGFVLLRALEPVNGIDAMKQRRNKEKLKDLCSGPGKLSMALGIGKAEHGSSLNGCFHSGETSGVVADRRIGISRERERMWRFLEEGNPHVSVALGKVK